MAKGVLLTPLESNIFEPLPTRKIFDIPPLLSREAPNLELDLIRIKFLLPYYPAKSGMPV